MLVDNSTVYILDFEDYDEGIYFVNNIEDLTRDWQKEYPDHYYEYKTVINEDSTVSVILNIYREKNDNG